MCDYGSPGGETIPLMDSIEVAYERFDIASIASLLSDDELTKKVASTVWKAYPHGGFFPGMDKSEMKYLTKFLRYFGYNFARKSTLHEFLKHMIISRRQLLNETDMPLVMSDDVKPIYVSNIKQVRADKALGIEIVKLIYEAYPNGGYYPGQDDKSMEYLARFLHSNHISFRKNSIINEFLVDFFKFKRSMYLRDTSHLEGETICCKSFLRTNICTC